MIEVRVTLQPFDYLLKDSSGHPVEHRDRELIVRVRTTQEEYSLREILYHDLDPFLSEFEYIMRRIAEQMKSEIQKIQKEKANGLRSV